MIDGISLLIRDLEDIERIRNNENLNFETKRGYLSAKYKGLEIKLRANSCWINGSLHKFKNEGEHNADDFTYSDLENTLIKLYDEVRFNPEFAEIKNIEIGINIKLPYNPSLFIESVIKRKTDYPILSSIGLEFKYSQYVIKIYSKSKQDKRYKDDNILRIEVRFTKMIQVKRTIGETKWLTDLLEPEFWFYSGRYLNTLLDEIDIIDMVKVVKDEIPTPDMIKVLKWRYLDRWEQCSTKRKRLRDIVLRASETHSLTLMKKNVQEIIQNKTNELLNHPKIHEFNQRFIESRKKTEKLLQINI